MAHSLSSKKRMRQNLKRRAANKSHMTALKSRIRTCIESVASKDAKTAEESFRAACKLIDREAEKGLIHKNNAARKKSRLARKLNTLRQATA